jgi:hypothetical protein
VVVGLAERHGLDDRALRRVVTLHEQHPLGSRVHAVGPGEKVDAGHLAHLVVDDEQGDRHLLAGQFAQHLQSRGGRRGTDHAEVLAEPPAEIMPECPHDPGVIIDHEQHGMRHLSPAPRAGCSG